MRFQISREGIYTMQKPEVTEIDIRMILQFDTILRVVGTRRIHLYTWTIVKN